MLLLLFIPPCVVAQDLLQLNQDAIEAERADLTRFTEEKNNEMATTMQQQQHDSDIATPSSTHS